MYLAYWLRWEYTLTSVQPSVSFLDNPQTMAVTEYERSRSSLRLGYYTALMNKRRNEYCKGLQAARGIDGAEN